MSKKKNQRNKSLRANKGNQILIQCATEVNRDSVRREVIDGAEHIIISSFTLPDNIVMNGGLYPAAAIAESFQTLERTLAPVEHPQDASGNFLSASDPIAISNFHAGAHNENVRQEDGRIKIDKHIIVQDAMKTEKGKRLLDRIVELETSDSPRPIHTSVGVYLIPLEFDEPQTNAAGDEFTWEASSMEFDHDAILLDSVGAAQPHQGVGIGVNSEGKFCDVQTFVLNAEGDLPATPAEDELSHEEIESALHKALQMPPFAGGWIARVFATTFIYSLDDQFFSAPYKMDNGRAVIVGIPLPVERDETFNPKVNQNEGDAMKGMIVNALKAAGIETEGLSDDELFAKYNALQATQNASDDDAASDKANLAEIANALKSVTSELGQLKAKLNEKDDGELKQYAEIIGNSDKYQSLDAAQAEKLGLETLKGMAANLGTAHALPFSNQQAAVVGVINHEMQD